ncbi:hypothetical protein GBA52_000353 [Prunus armeniaca]|nr:hypothetical protein GBA52_000353 [Prunus armeniaca]
MEILAGHLQSIVHANQHVSCDPRIHIRLSSKPYLRVPNPVDSPPVIISISSKVLLLLLILPSWRAKIKVMLTLLIPHRKLNSPT